MLDLAAGTGTSSQPFADAGATVVPCDFSIGMLQVGKKQLPHLPFTAGDGTQLPFADATFDAVTISFGLRNIVDPVKGLAEMRRVTRPGGRLVVCEFSHPTWSPWRTVYLEYLMKTLPAVAKAVSSSPDAYVYLAESIRAWPDQAGLAAMIGEAGWQQRRVAQPLRRHRRPASRLCLTRASRAVFRASRGVRLWASPGRCGGRWCGGRRRARLRGGLQTVARRPDSCSSRMAHLGGNSRRGSRVQGRQAAGGPDLPAPDLAPHAATPPPATPTARRCAGWVGYL